MANARRFYFLLFLPLVGTACAQELTPAIGLYPVCTPEHTGSRTKTVSNQDVIVGGRKSGTTCIILDKGSITYKRNVLRIFPYKNRPTEIRLACDSSGAEEFLGRHFGQDVSLFVGDRPIAIFKAARPITPEDCGLMTVRDVAQALEVCAAIVPAWGGSRAQCETICRDQQEYENKGVCAVVASGTKR